MQLPRFTNIGPRMTTMPAADNVLTYLSDRTIAQAKLICDFFVAQARLSAHAEQHLMFESEAA